MGWMNLARLGNFWQLSLANLLLPERGIATSLVQQLAMAPPLDDAALVHHTDQIGIDDRAQTVGDHQHRVSPLKALDRLLHQPLALGIQGTDGLIENQQLWIAQRKIALARLNRCRWAPLSR